MKNQLIDLFADTWGQTSLLWQRVRRPVLAKQGLTQTDKRILYGLYRLGQATKKQLAQQVVLEHSSLTRSLERLLNNGLVSRSVDKNDKRAVQISLTKAGLTKTQYIKDESKKQLHLLLKTISATELKQVIKVMQQLQAGMEQLVNK